MLYNHEFEEFCLRLISNVLNIWTRCEPFPTYPRTYDLLHGNGLLSHLDSQGCSIVEVLFEMDRMLRPEVILYLNSALLDYL